MSKPLVSGVECVIGNQRRLNGPKAKEFLGSTTRIGARQPASRSLGFRTCAVKAVV